MDIINNFKFPSAKLFFIIYRLWKTDEISLKQKTILKDMVISEDRDIMDSLIKYERTHWDLNMLSEDLKKIVNQKIINTQFDDEYNTDYDQDDANSCKSTPFINKMENNQDDSIEFKKDDRDNLYKLIMPQKLMDEQDTSPLGKCLMQQKQLKDNRNLKNKLNSKYMQKVIQPIMNQYGLDDDTSPLGTYLKFRKLIKRRKITAERNQYIQLQKTRQL